MCDGGKPVNCNHTKSACHFHAFIRNRATGNLSLAKLACRSWKCASCVQRKLKPMWRGHLTDLFRAHKGKLYRMTCAAEEWQTLYMRLFRAKAKFARLIVKGVYVIYSTKPITKFADAMDAETAISVMLRDMKAVEIGERAVSTSHDWALADDAASKYELVERGGKHSSVRAFEEVAKGHNLTVRHWTPDAASAVESGVEAKTTGWSDEQLKGFIAEVKAATAPTRLCKNLPYEASLSYQGDYYAEHSAAVTEPVNQEHPHNARSLVLQAS